LSWIITGFPIFAIVFSIFAARYPEFLVDYKSAIIPHITGSLLAAYWTRKSIQVSPEN